MAGIDTIEHIAKALDVASVEVQSAYCVVCRNRNASCRRCVEACPVDAIDIHQNEVTFDGSVCVGCGACVSACPTEAVFDRLIDDESLVATALRAADAESHSVSFRCFQTDATPVEEARLVCLARIPASLLIALACHGIRVIDFVDAQCSHCSIGTCSQQIDETIRTACDLLASFGIELTVRRSTREGHAASASDDRRSLISESREAALRIVSSFEESAEHPAVMHVGDDGALPRFVPAMRAGAVQALERFRPDNGFERSCGFFHSIDIDTDACTACMMCTVFCPTGAIVAGPKDEERKTLTFDDLRCVGCMTCTDVCRPDALRVVPLDRVGDLFDCEPKCVMISAPQGAVSSIIDLPRG